MRRTLILAVAVVLVVAVGVTIASFTVSSNAAVVNGTAISRQDLNSDLNAIADSPEYECYLRLQAVVNTGQYPPPLPGTGGGKDATNGATSSNAPVTYSTGFAGFWLDQMIFSELVSQANARQGVTLTSYDMTHARTALERQIDQTLGTAAQASGGSLPPGCPSSGSAALAGLPASLVDQLTTRVANEYALVFAAEGKRLSPATVAHYFDAHRQSFDTVCVVALPLQSPAQAPQITAQVAAGTPFATIAQGAGGGATCGEPLSAAPYAAAARLQPGQISAPVAYGQNYYLVQLTSIQPASLSSASDDVIQAIAQNAGAAGSARLATAQRESHVEVDPRYGHWVAAPEFTVAPPSSPPASSLLCPSANDPLATASVCPPPATVHRTGATTGAAPGAG